MRPDENFIEQIIIVDNSNSNPLSNISLKNITSTCGVEVIRNAKNTGYGAAHNIAILKSKSKYHLILNPDVVLDSTNLITALDYMEKHPGTASLSPSAEDEYGNKQYLAKNYPSVLDLLLRTLPPWIALKTFEERMSAYECRNLENEKRPREVKIISGCYMFCRRSMLEAAQLFDENFFLYFEDFALSIEMAKYGKIVYHPLVKIQHFGGNASRKGVKHIAYFIRSACRFFNKYGWRIW